MASAGYKVGDEVLVFQDSWSLVSPLVGKIYRICRIYPRKAELELDVEGSPWICLITDIRHLTKLEQALK